MATSSGKGNKRTSDEMAIGYCILCHQECDEDRSRTSIEAWTNMKEHAAQWCGLDMYGTVYDDVAWDNGPENVYFHKLCKTQMFSRNRLELALRRHKKLQAEEHESSTSQRNESNPQQHDERKSRSQTGLIHDKNLCIWCMKPEDRKHPGRDKWCTMEQMDAWYAFKGHTVYLDDLEMRERLLTFISATSDPFAVEVRYHRSCWKKYIPINREDDNPRLHIQHVQLSEAREIFFRHVRSVVLENHELRTLQSLLQDYIRILNNFGIATGVLKSSTLKAMLQNEFQDRIGFHERAQKNLSTLVYDTSAGGSYVEAAMNCWGVSDEQLIQTAARRIQTHVSSQPVMSWPPHVDELVEDEESDELLSTFVTALKTSKSKTVNTHEDPEIMALVSLLTSYMTKSRTPFKVKLSVTMHGLTRSREIIDLLKKFALGISYKDVLSIHDSWAKYDMEQNKACPEELAVGIPGTAVMDNDDFKEDTLTGADTSHRTNVMFIQPQDVVTMNADTYPTLQIPTPQEMKELCVSQHTVQPYKTVERGIPSTRPDADISSTCDTIGHRQRGLIHVLVRLDETQNPVSADDQTVGAFAGFQASIQPPVTKSKPYYFLTFPSSPHKSVVHEVMDRMVAAANDKSMPFVQLVGDQPVYALIVQLRYEHPEKFSIVMPCMGPFHIHCSFIYAMDKRFRGSGLSDILVAAGVIAEGSVDQALRGKHYKRSIRCLRLMYEALLRKLVQHSLEMGSVVVDDVNVNLKTLQDPSSSTAERQSVYKELESNPAVMDIVAEEFERIKNSGSPMASYWISFLEMTEILMLNIHALRTQNWEEFTGSLRLMLPWMQIYDNDKYGKWMVEYWLEMSNLPEDRAAYMRDGLFAQSMTGNPYSCLPLDLWIEMTMNKGSKMKAGWLKILKNDKLLLTDSRNANSINRVRSSLHTTCNTSTSTHKHSENTKTRVRIDEKAVQDINSCIDEFECDPFNLDNMTLRSLQSGVMASPALVKDFETAHKDGEIKLETFCKDRMLSSNTPFYSAVKRSSRHNFSNPPPVDTQHNDRVRKTEAMENRAMASIISLAEAHDGKFSLVDVMEYRVTDECLSIFNINGTMRKTQKSKLVDRFNTQPVNNIPETYIAIIDMGLVWHLSTPSLEDRQRSDGTSFTWRDYASKMFSLILKRHQHATQIVLVNDRYDLPYTIKDSERHQRSRTSEGSRNVFIRPLDKFPSQRGFQEFLSKPANKQRLQMFLQSEFTTLCRGFPTIQLVYSMGPICCSLPEGTRLENFECQHIEADTTLFFIYSKIRQSGNEIPVIIDAEDTDVLVLAAYVANNVDGSLMIKRRRDIIDCETLCPKEISDIIIPLHVVSGCDTTSAFFGHGKTSIYDRVVSSPEARCLLSSVGREVPVPQAVLDGMAVFTIKYIYNDKVTKSLAGSRARKWLQMKRKSTQRLPPDPDSHDMNVARVNYQSYLLCNYGSANPAPSPLEHGWTLENGICIPVRHARPALPRHLSEVPEGTDPGSDSDTDSDGGQSDSGENSDDTDAD